ncbi:MAG: sulfatase-like hydrolase/transferase [Coxiellaceae bacterium]|nr:sulfatase-like hydrolase/transferase [Coxiellaceae bacterium]
MNSLLLSNRRWWLTLIICNAVVFCATAFPIFSFQDGFFYCLFYGAQNFLFACMVGIVLWPIFRFVPIEPFRVICLGLIEAVALIYTFMNAKIYAFWHVFINDGLLHLYFSKGGGSQVFEISFAMYIWITIAIALCALLGVLLVFLAKFLKDKFSPIKWVYFLMAGYVIAQSSFLFFAREDKLSILQNTIAIPYFYQTSWVNSLEAMGVRIFPRSSLIYQLRNALVTRQKLAYPAHPLHYHLPARPLNVLLIVVDTLRYDMVNPTNMPNVYRFSNNTNQFLDNISGGNCTRPGIFSLFYGIPATNWATALQDEQPSILIRAFQDNHYRMKLLGSASLLSPPFNRTVFAGVPHLQLMTKGGDAAERDQTVTAEMQQFLKAQAKSQRPFFGFIFYDAPHAYNAIGLKTPFSPTKALNYFAVNKDESPKPVFNLYKNAVFYDDQLIQKILMTLQKNDLMKNTVVIFTSDHGQEFNEYHNNYWEHASGFSKYQIRTPLLIAWPGMSAKKYDYQTTHFDLAPTLLKRVLGVSNPMTDYAVGHDFFSKKQVGFTIVGNYAYYAVVTKNQVIAFHDSGLYQFYDSHMTLLPQEKTNTVLMNKVLQKIKMY